MFEDNAFDHFYFLFKSEAQHRSIQMCAAKGSAELHFPSNIIDEKVDKKTSELCYLFNSNGFK